MTRPLLLGHRGARASRHIPENTLASFELCLSHGCDGFEFDVRLSRDGVGVVCHDESFGGNLIAETTAQELDLPTLEDVLRQFTARAFLDIELKVAGLEQQMIHMLKKYLARKGVVVSSFLPDVLATLHELDPSVSLGSLCESKEQLRGWVDSPAEWVIPCFDLADRKLIEEIRAARKKIAVWTVNQSDSMREFIAWGVDAIISDETELLITTVRK